MYVYPVTENEVM